MTQAKELTKKPLYRLSDGKKQGEIKDLFLDGEAKRVAAVYLGKEGVFTRKILIVLQDQVRVMGVDAWLTAGASEVEDLKQLGGGEAFILVNDLRGRELQTARETKIGTVGDVEIDEQGQVVGFTLGKVHIQGPVAKRGMVPRATVSSLGDDDNPMVVDLEAAEASAFGESGDGAD
jgi:uncharacterized protein YrrD